MQTQTYHHPIQKIPHANAFYLFMQAHREFENVDFGCEKRDRCRTEKTVLFRRKSPLGLEGTFRVFSRLIKRPSLEVQTPLLLKHLLHHHMASRSPMDVSDGSSRITLCLCCHRSVQGVWRHKYICDPLQTLYSSIYGLCLLRRIS